MKYLKKFNESGRVVGFKYKSPDLTYVINFNVLSNDDVTKVINGFLKELNVDCKPVEMDNRQNNSYRLVVNVYDEKEVDQIIDDLSLKMLVKGQKIDDVTRNKVSN